MRTMLGKVLKITFLLFFSIIISQNSEAAPPEQVHLATNGIFSEIVVQWGTQEDTTFSCSSSTNVEYGIDSNLNDLS